MAQDDDLAAELLHAPPPGPPRRPLYEFTSEVREMRALVDRMGIAVQYLSRGQYQPSALEEPEQTAMQRRSFVVGWETHHRLTAQLLPDTAEEV